MAGVDGSPGGLTAARYGASLAERRNVPLRLIHVFESLFYGYGPLFAAGNYAVADEQLHAAAQRSLANDAEQIRAAYPGLTVEADLLEGLPAAVLIEESQDAVATVVGTRGLGGFAGLQLGSVSSQVAAHGHGPVVVVRPAEQPDGPVLVGFDGSEASQAALTYGIREALDLKVPLAVANVYWEEPLGLQNPWGSKEIPDPAVTAVHKSQQLIDDALELAREEHPDLQIEIRTIHSMNPEYSLVEESAHASLTIVGCRGRGGFAGLLLGSVSRTLVHHAAGPVAVLHPTAH
ncbi:universal stress protein [Rhizocola hellebori]|uniref:Universal stress protein n=1 Tax=Rhizocola hellebori TaxID=1392758 RepID=A0A8J3VJD5_9ACTN|nr:universal stress protein [Rhizocola hellebori]